MRLDQDLQPQRVGLAHGTGDVGRGRTRVELVEAHTSVVADGRVGMNGDPVRPELTQLVHCRHDRIPGPVASVEVRGKRNPADPGGKGAFRYGGRVGRAPAERGGDGEAHTGRSAHGDPPRADGPSDCRKIPSRASVQSGIRCAARERGFNRESASSASPAASKRLHCATARSRLPARSSPRRARCSK